MIRIKIVIILVIVLGSLIAGCLHYMVSDLNEWADRYGFDKDEVFPIEIGNYGFPYACAKIDGKDINMMLDTGNMVGFSVSPNVAVQLGLTKTGEYTERDTSGNIRGSFAIYDSVDVFVFGSNITAELRESFTDSFEGSLPPSLFSDKRFTIDYSNGFIGISESSFPKPIVNKETFQLVENTEFPHLRSMPVIEGMVNDHKVIIQLDTGKSRTVVDEKLTEALNLQQNEEGYKIDSIKLGSFEFSVTDAKKGNFRGISKGYPGPIMLGLGSDTISEFVFTVDYLNNKVIISR